MVVEDDDGWVVWLKDCAGVQGPKKGEESKWDATWKKTKKKILRIGRAENYESQRSRICSQAHYRDKRETLGRGAAVATRKKRKGQGGKADERRNSG